MSNETLAILILAASFVTGACLGSFANVMGLRLLKEEEFVKTPSHCTSCNTNLQWYENIPIVSWVIQGGKCRTCKTSISVQYPIIELLTAALFFGVTLQFGVGLLDGGSEAFNAALRCALLYFLVFNLMVILITDWRESVIFILNSLLLVPAGFIFNLLQLGEFQGSQSYALLGVTMTLPVGVVESILGILVAIALFEGLILLSRLAFGTDGFGHGDTHMMMGVGAFLGWKMCLLAIGLGFIVQMIPAVPLLIYQWIKQKQWRPLISGGLATGFALFPLAFTNSPEIIKNFALYAGLTVGSIVLSLAMLVVFMKAIKQTESFTYLPLGPALVISSLICLFCGNELLGRLF